MAAAAAVDIPHQDRSRSRSPPLTLSDFQQLVTNAFDLHSDAHTQQRPSLAFRRRPTPLPRANSSLSATYTPTDNNALSNISSRDCDTPHQDLPFPHSNSRTTFGVLKAFTSRASAFLRTSVPDPDATILPIPSNSNSTSRPSTARPSVSSQRTLQPLAVHSFAPAQLARSSDSSSSPSTQPSNTPLARVRTKSLPKSFLKMSPHGIHPAPPLPLAPLDSFFDASSVNERSRFPSYAHPFPRPQVHIHTQLPPLRKSKSFAAGLFGKKIRRSSSKLSDRLSLPRTKSTYGLRTSQDMLEVPTDDPRCPSPFTNPRDAPPAPPKARELKIPDYGSQRRGSATSTCTSSSTRTTSTFSDRVSSVFSVPTNFPFMNRSRSHSKLHLSIPSSTQSSPSSVSTATTSPPVTPLSPTFSFGGNSSALTFPFASHKNYPASVRIDPNSSRISLHCLETEEEALAIGRVLTPEPDPFAKPEIELGCNFERDTTPRPMSAQSRLWSPDARRKRESTNSRSGASVAFSDELSTYAEISPSYSFPSSCSIHPMMSSEIDPCSTVAQSTPPSPTRLQMHPPSAWSPHCSPVVKVRALDGPADFLKDLPPRPPSRPLPHIPSPEADVFGSAPIDALDSTPRKAARLRRERRSINSFVSPGGSPSSLRSTLSTSLPSGSPMAVRFHQMQKGSPTSTSGRPPSPFPLVRELSGESRQIAKDLSLTTNSDGSGIDIGRSRRESPSFEGQDESCVLSKAFLQSLGLEKKPYSSPLVATTGPKDIPQISSRTTDVSAESRKARRDTPVPSMYGVQDVIADINDTDEDDWDDTETTRSTAFFSARSSILSAESEEDITVGNVFTDPWSSFPQTPTLEYSDGKSYF